MPAQDSGPPRASKGGMVATVTMHARPREHTAGEGRLRHGGRTCGGDPAGEVDGAAAGIIFFRRLEQPGAGKKTLCSFGPKD